MFFLSIKYTSQHIIGDDLRTMNENRFAENFPFLQNSAFSIASVSPIMMNFLIYSLHVTFLRPEIKINDPSMVIIQLLIISLLQTLVVC